MRRSIRRLLSMIAHGLMVQCSTTRLRIVISVERKLEWLIIWKIKETSSRKLIWKSMYSPHQEVSYNSSSPSSRWDTTAQSTKSHNSPPYWMDKNVTPSPTHGSTTTQCQLVNTMDKSTSTQPLSPHLSLSSTAHSIPGLRSLLDFTLRRIC